MKPVRISIKGLNSFVEEQVIDFETLASQGIFGIFGPTGSGKSTILDGITFALYGKIARESGGRDQYINVNSAAARVVFDFEVNADQRQAYKIIREIKRQKNGKSITTQCKIVRTTDDCVLAEKERETSEQIHQIIGLSYDDFVKTVVLPQGGFNDFLRMEGKERRSILERLFNLEQYGNELDVKLSARAKKVEMERSELEGLLKSYGDLNEEVVEEQKIQLQKLQEELSVLEKDKKYMQEKTERVKRQYEEQQELLKLQKELAEELQKSDKIKEMESSLERAQKADKIQPLTQDYQKLRSEGKAASDTLNKVLEKYEQIQKEEQQINELFERTEKQKSEEYPRLLRRQQALTTALNRWTQYLDSRERAQHIQKQMQQIDKDRQLNEQAYQKALAQEEESREKRNRYQDYIDKNQVASERTEALRDAVERIKKIEEFNRQQDALQEDWKEVNEQIRIVQNQLLQTKEKLKAVEEKEKQNLQIQSELKNNPLLDAAFLTTEKFRLQQAIEADQKQKKLNIELASVEKKISEIQHQEEQNKQDLEAVEKQYLQFKNDYEAGLIQNSVHRLRNHLHTGEHCPVCDALIQEPIAKSDAERDLHPIQQALDKLSKQKQSLIGAQGSIKEQFKNLQNEKNEKQEQLKALIINDENVKDMEQRFLQWEKDEEKIKAQWEQSLLQEKELSQEKSNYQQSMAALMSKMEGDQKYIQKIEQQKTELEAQITSAIDEKNQLLENLGTTRPCAELEQIHHRLKQIQQYQKELSTLSKQQREEETILRQLQNEINHRHSEFVTLRTQQDELNNQIRMQEEELQTLIGKLIDPKAEMQEVEKQLKALENLFEDVKEQKQQFEKQASDIQQKKIQLEKSLEQLRDMARNRQEELYEKIEELGFQQFSKMEKSEKLGRLFEIIEWIDKQILSKEDTLEKKEQVRLHHNLVSEKNGAIQTLEKRIGTQIISEEEFENQMKQDEAMQAQYKELLQSHTSCKQKYKENARQLKEIAQYRAKEQVIDKKLGMLKELRSVVGARKFVEFMATKQLEYVTIEATQRLADITNGAYCLEVNEEGAFRIRDNKNGGVLRNVKTLSGGETFVVSLSLALALSAQIQLKGVAPLELFFLDEGFGTLDDDLLEIVMDSLEKIHHDRLKVGIISHVEQLKQRIPVKLMVTPAKAGEGGSKTRIEYS